MHYLYFVLLGKDEATTSQEARDMAQSRLEEENFASDQNGFFGSSKADWYVIGGRWSGELTRLMLDKEKLKKCDDEFEKEYGWHTGGEEKVTKEQRHEQYKTVFAKHFPEFAGLLPQWRDTYAGNGFEDDAMQLTEPLLEALQKEYNGKKVGEMNGGTVEVFDAENFDETTVDRLTKEDIGKWIVVVDYHN